jgi:hypothetical protein
MGRTNGMTPMEAKKTIRTEFANTNIEDMEHFAGGCKKSKKAAGWCAGFNNGGAIGKFHCGCRHYAQCPGSHLQYNP